MEYGYYIVIYLGKFQLWGLFFLVRKTDHIPRSEVVLEAASVGSDFGILQERKKVASK